MYLYTYKGLKMKTQTIQTFQEIKDEISKKELLEIMELALEIGLEEAIELYIDANYYTLEEVA